MHIIVVCKGCDSMRSPAYRRIKFRVKHNIAKINFFKYIMIIIIIISFIIALRMYNNSFKPQLKTLSETRAYYICNNAINEGVWEVISDNDLKYEDLISFIKDNDGAVTALMTNLVAANRLKSEFALSINEKINNLDNVEISIPFGNITGIELLSGIGPSLNIKLVPTGQTVIDFKNSFMEAGINQTRHEIYLEVKSTVSILMPTKLYSKTEVTSKIPLAESVIVGKVPDSITRLETSDETLRDDILNIY